jgi:hypothetical protein
LEKGTLGPISLRLAILLGVNFETASAVFL